MKLSVIVPCFNEAESVDEFYEAITKKLVKEKISYELIMVNDGSYDITLSKLKDLALKDKNVKIISFSKNFGKESAMLAGMKNASGEYVSIIDADLQQTPDTLIQMYNKLIENPDYDSVAAYKESHADESRAKRVLTSMFYKVINKISVIRLLPGASDFRVFKKAVNDAIISLPEKTRFLKGIFSWIGFNTIYVPYSPNKRLHGTSKWSLFRLTKYALGGIISFSTLPIKIIFIIGLLVFLIGIINFFLMGNLSHRTIILFISLIMLSLGIMSLYVSRIYSNILARPSYIIREKIGFDKKTTK